MGPTLLGNAGAVHLVPSPAGAYNFAPPPPAPGLPGACIGKYPFSPHSHEEPVRSSLLPLGTSPAQPRAGVSPVPGVMPTVGLQPSCLGRAVPRGSIPGQGPSHLEQRSLLGPRRAGTGRGLARAGARAGPHPRGDVVQALQVSTVRTPGSGRPLTLGSRAEGPREAGVFGSWQVRVCRRGCGGCQDPWETTVGQVGWAIDPRGHDQGVERSLVEPGV